MKKFIGRYNDSNIIEMNELFNIRCLLTVMNDSILADMFSNALDVSRSTFDDYKGVIRERCYFSGHEHQLGDVFASYNSEDDAHPSCYIIFSQNDNSFIALAFIHKSQIIVGLDKQST